MKAIRFHQHGGPEVLVYEDVPCPEAGPGQALVRVHAASVNPADWKGRLGRGRAAANVLPVIPGWDISGVIETLGPAVRGFREGDAVYGMIWFPKPGNAYAEYAVAPVTDIAHKPQTLSHVQAAALPLAVLTAWQGLFDTAHLAAGHTVLITGASGGVGHLAVQLAKWKGAHVIGTASGRNADFVRSLGVDEFVDYTTTKVEEAVHGVDVVFDAVSHETIRQALEALRPGGILVSIAGGPPSPELVALAEQLKVRLQAILVKPDSAELAEVAKLVDSGFLKPVIDTVLPLAAARKAHELSETNRTRGKIVLAVVDDSRSA